MSTFGLERAFGPKNVAIVGGSKRPGSLGTMILENLTQSGFAGEIAVVNSRYDSIGDKKAYPSLAALPFVPDLIVVTTPAPSIPDIIDQAGKCGVAGAVIISSGLGHGPGSIAEAVSQAARAHGVRIVGPNCLGVMFPRIGLNASFAARHSKPGSLALIS